MIHGKTTANWVFVIMPTNQPLADDVAALYIPGSKHGEEWRPDMGFFRHGGQLYYVCLEAKDKVQATFQASLITPDMWLVLIDANGSGKACITANMSIPDDTSKPPIELPLVRRSSRSTAVYSVT
jgi:hypothetical protein